MWAPVWGPKTTAKTGLATEGLPSSRACADIHACRAWRTIARGAAKSWKPSGMQNLSCTRGDNRNLHYFLPGGKNFADKTTPVSGSVFGPQNGVRFVGKIVVTERKTAQVSIVSSCTRQKFPIPLGFQGFAAPRVLVLHTLRTFMSTRVLELGRPSVATPVLLVFLDPKMKATNSPENAI